MRSDRASDLGWTNEVREALRRPNVGPLSTPRTWRDRARTLMMGLALAAGCLAGLVAIALVLAGVTK